MSGAGLYNRYDFPWMIIGIILLIVLAIAWFIAEFTHTRTFTGKLNNKYTEIYYTHDEERAVSHTDKDGNVSFSTEGSDETTAHINYVLNFYSEGKLRPVSAGKFSATVYRLHAEQMALRKLYENHTEPAHYTYTKDGEEYLVDVRGWLMDGTVKDITLLKLVPGEKL